MLNPASKTHSRIAGTPLVSFGRYECRLGNRSLGPEAATATHVINLHTTGTYRKQVEGRDVFVEPGMVLFYPRGQVYRTSHPHGCGDSGRRFSLRGDWLIELCAASDPSARDRPEHPWSVDALVPDPRLSLAIERLYARLPSAETLEIEEACGVIVGEIARRAARAPRCEPRLSAHQRALADALRSRLATRLGEPTDLDSLSLEIGASPFALCRAFKAATGTTMSSWRRRVRLQRALEHVLGSREELLPIALACGFASHSHLTREFHAAFGCTPSALRRRVRERARFADEIRASLATGTAC